MPSSRKRPENMERKVAFEESDPTRVGGAVPGQVTSELSAPGNLQPGRCAEDSAAGDDGRSIEATGKGLADSYDDGPSGPAARLPTSKPDSAIKDDPAESAAREIRESSGRKGADCMF